MNKQPLATTQVVGSEMLGVSVEFLSPTGLPSQGPEVMTGITREMAPPGIWVPEICCLREVCGCS